jgi:hypothetical protein
MALVAHRAIAKVLFANAGNSSDFSFDTESPIPGRGRFSTVVDSAGKITRTLHMDMAKLKTGDSFDVNMFESILLHELIHGQSSELISLYERGLKDNALYLPPAIQKSIKSLDTLRRTLVSQLSEADQYEFEEFAALSPEEKLDYSISGTEEEVEAKKTLYYGLSSTSEFVTQTLTSETFQKDLSNRVFNGEKSILQRFLDLMGSLMESLSKSLGVKVDGTALQVAVEASLNLLEQTQTYESLNKNNNPTDVSEDALMSSVGKKFSPASSKMSTEIKDFLHDKNKASGVYTDPGQTRYFRLGDAGRKTAMSKARQINTKNKAFMNKYGDDYTIRSNSTQFGYELTVQKYDKVPLESSKNEELDFSELESLYNLEATIDPSVQKIVDQLTNRKKTLQRKSHSKRGDNIIYQERIDALQVQIDALLEENSISQVGSVAGVQLDWASKVLDKSKLTDSEIMDVSDLVNSWLIVKDIFDDQYSGKFATILNDISNRAKDLDTRVKKINREHMMELTKKNTSQEIEISMFETMTDASVGAANFLDISRLNNPAVQALAEWLHDAARDTNYEFTQVETEMRKAFDKLKNTAEYKNNKFDIFLQKGEDGAWTGGLVNRQSQAWYDELNRQSKKRAAAGDKGWKGFFKWKRDNETLVDTRSLFDKVTGERLNDATSKKHTKQLSDEFGVDRAEEMINQAEKKHTQYLLDLQTYEDQLAVELGSTTSKEYVGRVNSWTLEHSPTLYINSYTGGSVLKGAKLRGYKYVVTKPKAVGLDGKKTNWYDSSYEQIESNPELLEFYNFYRGMMKEMMSNLPTYEAGEQQANFIPFIQKSLVQQFSKGGVRAGLSGLYGNFIDSLAEPDSVSVSTDRDVKTGEINKRVPIRFLQEGDPETKSMDLIKGLELFSLMSLNYKHKIKIEDRALLMKRLISEAAEQQVTAKGDSKWSGADLFKTKGGGSLQQTKSSVDFAINAALYGERRDKGAATGIVFANKFLDSPKATKLSRKIQLLNKKLQANQITEEEFDEQVTPLQEELTAIGGKNLTTVDVAGFMIKMTQLKGMAFNVFSATTNMTFGLISNMIHAAGREDFTTRQAGQAYGMMLASTSKSLGLDRAGVGTSQAKKINNLIRKFDILFEVNDSAHKTEHTSSFGNAFSKLSPYELQKRSEYFIQGQVMIAKMLNTPTKRIGDSGEATATLWDAFDENGNWNVEDFGQEIGWMGDVNVDGELNDMKKFRNHIIQLNKRLHGNYDPNSIPKIKKSILGRFAMQFRSWTAEGFATRFESLDFDRQLDRDIKGTYRTMWDVTLEFGFMKTLKSFAQVAMRSKNGLEGLPDVDKANFRKALSEMTWVLGMVASGLLIEGLADDDDDDDAAKARNIVLNQIYRLQADLTFFDNPTSFNSIITNPIPAMRLFTDFSKAMSATWKLATQDEDLDKRSKMTAEKVTMKWLKNLPFGSQIPKAIYQTEKIMFK